MSKSQSEVLKVSYGSYHGYCCYGGCVQQLLVISINKMKYDEGYNFLTEVLTLNL